MSSIGDLDEKLILPLRYIPFDIGLELSDDKIEALSAYLESRYERVIPSGFSHALGSDLVLIYQLDENVRVSIFSYGVGVLSYPDTPYQISDSDFAIDYCQQRKKAHRDILLFSDPKSEMLGEIIRAIREIAQKGEKTIRESAFSDWECGGLSYVMTVSLIQTKSDSLQWAALNDKWKKNLLVLLRPSLVNMEDSIYSSYETESYLTLDRISLERCDEPKNYSYVDSYAIYISWAAVVVLQNQIDQSLVDLMESLEIDLQAMWMYIYCEKNELNSRKLSPALTHKHYFLQRKYVRFLSISDSSVADYITKIRAALIETSGIDNIFQEYKEDMNYMLRQLESTLSVRKMRLENLKTVLLGMIAIFLFIIILLLLGRN